MYFAARSQGRPGEFGTFRSVIHWPLAIKKRSAEPGCSHYPTRGASEQHRADAPFRSGVQVLPLMQSPRLEWSFREKQ